MIHKVDRGTVSAKIPKNLIAEIDGMVDKIRFRSRSHVIEFLLDLGLNEMKKKKEVVKNE